MNDYTVRTIRPDETRAAGDLFRSTLHLGPVKDDEWPYAERMHQPQRGIGAFDGELIGTVRSFDTELTVPGGTRLPFAAVTGVGVRPDRTRRGVLRAMMRAQLDDFTTRGVPLAGLYASEAVIYGRFGYGAATVTRDFEIDRRRAALRPEVPAGGEVSLLSADKAVERLPELYANLLGDRPGRMTRSPHWWPGFERALRRAEAPVTTVVHHGPGGADGFAQYTVDRHHWSQPSEMDVWHLEAANDDAYAGLWRYLLGVDLVDRIKVPGRPLDEPVELLLTNPRACDTVSVDDGLWLRLVDVPAALAAREYDGEPVVLEVTDPFLPANSGCYRVCPDGVSRTDVPGELRLTVDALAMLYLGAWRASALATAGRIQPAEPKALARADRLFATTVAAWCGTHF
ncbi:GNAT family N-acetyltransferase [Amycolatopsis sp. K13G38]|uniref:GNAT family N-acetyltransferase n=1 Tax=Amycolatopsis acididurans TaxID=2724524 RepID=A0ABX1J1K5_9PSEU|nr:GNAT family N-acetyltransferase [Amycolatopsis acididurans]NKQ52235.1 GNAT family N-acetyltransferase [Amycolatopsis acididurans]